MIAGFAAQERNATVLGIDGSATVEQTWAQIARIARQTAEKVGLGRELADEEIVLLDEWHAGTTASPTRRRSTRSASAPGSKACSPTRSTRGNPLPRSSTSSATAASRRARASSTRTSAGQPALNAYAGAF